VCALNAVEKSAPTCSAAAAAAAAANETLLMFQPVIVTEANDHHITCELVFTEQTSW